MSSEIHMERPSWTRRQKRLLTGSDRAGATVVEILVVISTIALLLSLLIPAVVSARSSARNVQCQNNLKNLGLALHNFEGTRKRFPDYAFVKDKNSYSFSVHVQLLPYLEQDAIYQRLNFQKVAGHPENIAIIREAKNAVFRCAESHTDHVGTSYLGNCGTGLNADLSRRQDGFLIRGGARTSDIVVGLANIVAFAECAPLASTPQNSGLLVLNDEIATFGQYQSFTASCRAATPGELNRSPIGVPWSLGGEVASVYQHIFRLTENSCWASGPGTVSIGTANSPHAAQVNAVRGDGSVSGFSKSMDRDVWIRLGSRLPE